MLVGRLLDLASINNNSGWVWINSNELFCCCMGWVVCFVVVVTLHINYFVVVLLRIAKDKI